MSGQLLDFFFQAEFQFFQLGYVKIIACGMVKFALNLSFESFVPAAQLGNMRLQRHIVPTFVSVVGDLKSMTLF